MPKDRVISTGQPRHGRRFVPVQELELMGDAELACTGFPGFSDETIIVSEMTAPIGIPDLTVVVPIQDRLNKRLASPIPPVLSRTDAALISAMPRGTARATEWVARQLSWPEETVERRSATLLRTGALRRNQNGLLVRPTELQRIGRSFVVEAKVRDWTRGMRQVSTYLLWADAGVLVVGALSARSIAAAKQEARMRGIGLLVNGSWIARPRLQPSHSSHQLWASEHLVNALRS